MSSSHNLALVEWAEENDLPTDQPEDVRGQILGILRNGNIGKVEKNNQVALAVVTAIRDRGQFYFDQECGDFATAMFYDEERRVLENIQSNRFQAWLSRWSSINRADPLFDYVMKQVETTALDPECSSGILPEHYWAFRPGAIYLSSGEGAIYKITACGVELCDNGTDGILFSADHTLKPWALTEPVDPFETCRLFKEASYENAHGAHLLRAYAVTLPHNPPCKPILAAVGPIGSGKTKVVAGISHLYGLPEVCIKADEKKADDFWVSINGGGLVIVDNVDSHIKWLADALATASTNGSSSRRKLYTDSKQVMLRARAWTAVTSANPTFAGDAGLADRLLVVRMVRRTGQTEDAALLDEISANRAAGLSYIAQTLSQALGDHTEVPCGLNSRHPDFARMACRVGRVMGLEAETVSALGAAESDKSQHCLENDIVGAALMQLVGGDDEFSGSAVDLQPLLAPIDSSVARLSIKSLGKRINNLWPHIQSVLCAHRHQTGGTWRFVIRRKAL